MEDVSILAPHVTVKKNKKPYMSNRIHNGLSQLGSVERA